jgi:hypothetical protein
MSNSFGPSGGTGGDSFSVLPPSDNGPWKISAIQVWSADRIDGLEVIWSNQHGDVRTSPKLGGTGGVEHEFQIGQDDFLTRIEGSVGSFNDNVRLFSLQLFTKNGKSSDLFGKPASDKFQYDGVTGYQILGLFGRSGSAIDALGTVLTNSVPA